MGNIEYLSIKREEIPEEYRNQLLQAERKLLECSHGQAEKICIFGLGEMGIKLMGKLKARFFKVDWACDNDASKKHYIINGTPVIDWTELVKIKDKVLVVIAVSDTFQGAIDKQLKEEHFPYICTCEEVEAFLEDIPPVRWLSAFDGIDYTDECAIRLVERFKETIYEICRCYEG